MTNGTQYIFQAIGSMRIVYQYRIGLTGSRNHLYSAPHPLGSFQGFGRVRKADTQLQAGSRHGCQQAVRSSRPVIELRGIRDEGCILHPIREDGDPLLCCMRGKEICLSYLRFDMPGAFCAVLSKAFEGKLTAGG